jgi:hypothetical protein
METNEKNKEALGSLLLMGNVCASYESSTLLECAQKIAAWSPLPDTLTAPLIMLLGSFPSNEDAVALAQTALQLDSASAAAAAVEGLVARILGKCATGGSNCVELMIGTQAQAKTVPDLLSQEYPFAFAAQMTGVPLTDLRFITFAKYSFVSLNELSAAGLVGACDTLQAFKRTDCNEIINANIVSNFLDGNGTLIEQCNDDEEDARRIELAQKLVPASVAMFSVSLILGIVALAANKTPAGIVSGVFSIIGVVALLVALLQVKGAPVYANVGGDPVALEPLYSAGLANTLAYVCLAAPLIGGITIIVGSLMARGESDELTTKVDATY